MAPRVRVRFLGTGGALNECRRQACLLVETLDGATGPVLLDTGNGLDVIRQMLAVGYDPCDVRDVFVSHQHADHVGGLDPFLLWTVIATVRRHKRDIEQTNVYAELRILDCIDRLFAATATTTPKLYDGRLQMVPVEDGTVLTLPRGGTLTTFLVDHEPKGGGALGCVLEMAGVRLAYSGDTRPSPRLVEMCRDADVLFHEAGGIDERSDFLHGVGHSTAGDAGRAARAAGARRLILTHLPDGASEAMVAEASSTFGARVDLATDLDSIEL